MQMPRELSIAILTVLFALTGCGGNEQPKSANTPKTSTKAQAAPALAAGDAAKGQPLFVQYCSACHGPDAKGLKGLGKDLTHNEFINGMTDEQFLEYVNTGRAIDDPRNTTGIPMPPKGGNPALQNAEIMHIIAYLRTLQ